ncbi:uncharacterized protein LAESUDRAFT_816888 [Laetiporus sulphureus 93-53]|uniref:Uncharacterized protein n=1 Tax=Laetiporus sulphureus 93-53 TaxID=1314785 RepID=A0A165ATZ1_9APHY|nr:uncharacterized protein LAESUDRAFT_816888 [Laetiporus sulphureus 93-53]KZS99657.1 hypothetical protein LAESUDRAFT_816888 [Laetiporus sulphureus 93-53]
MSTPQAVVRSSRTANANPTVAAVHTRALALTLAHVVGNSISLEEMLLEATTDDDHDRFLDSAPAALARPHAQSLSLVPTLCRSRITRRSTWSSRTRVIHLGVPPNHVHSRSLASSSLSFHPLRQQLHLSAFGPGVSPPGSSGVSPIPGHSAGGNRVGASGPLPAPGQVHTYQRRIFAPPVTSVPVKKSKLGSSQSLGANGTVLTLGPMGRLIAAPSTIQGGGYPPTNAQGQRICRQCGLPRRYKEGKCVEKWGPGPEGLGTVCDRCRKKMKRQPAAIHPSSHHQNSLNGRPGPDLFARFGPNGTVLSSPPYGCHEREGDEQQRPIPSPHAQSARTGSQRLPPTPPYIATLPGSSVNDDDDVFEIMTEGRSCPVSSGASEGFVWWATHERQRGHIFCSRLASRLGRVSSQR